MNIYVEVHYQWKTIFCVVPYQNHAVASHMTFELNKIKFNQGWAKSYHKKWIIEMNKFICYFLLWFGFL